MKNILLLLLTIIFLISCSKEEQEGEKITNHKEYSITVASKKLQGVVGTGVNILYDVYAVQVGTSQKWEPLSSVQNFDYEAGYEYLIKISETHYLDFRRGDPAWCEYKLIEIISKEQKSSEGLPEHFIPDWYPN